MGMNMKNKAGFVSPQELMAQVRAQGGGAPSPTLEGLGVEKPAELPWLNAHPKVKIHFGLRIPEKLHLQFEYAANHTLGDSMQTFALRALEEAVHTRLKELGVI